MGNPVFDLLALLALAAIALTLGDIWKELRDANDLRREEWAEDYKRGRNEKPVRLRR